MPNRDWTWPRWRWPRTWAMMWKCIWSKNIPFEQWKWNQWCGWHKWEGNRRKKQNVEQSKND